MNSLMPDGGGLTIKSETTSDNRRVRFSRLPLVAIIATRPVMSERFDQGASFVAAFQIFGFSEPSCCFRSDPSPIR